MSSAQISPIYTRVHLRSLKRIENERIKKEYINQGIANIENLVFTAAKGGLVKYTTEPFAGCDDSSLQFDKDICQSIVSGIKALVYERFPDSELLYDPETKQYTLRWD